MRARQQLPSSAGWRPDLLLGENGITSILAVHKCLWKAGIRTGIALVRAQLWMHCDNITSTWGRQVWGRTTVSRWFSYQGSHQEHLFTCISPVQSCRSAPLGGSSVSGLANFFCEDKYFKSLGPPGFCFNTGWSSEGAWRTRVWTPVTVLW